MNIKSILQNIINWIIDPSNTEIIEILTNIITSLGVLFGFIFSIITLRQSKKAQIDQQKEIEENRFEERRGILQIYTKTHDVSSSLAIECLIIKNIGKSPLKIIEFLPSTEFMQLETQFWGKFMLSKSDIWISPGQTYKYLCNLDEVMYKNKNNLNVFSINYTYETLGRVFEEEIEWLNYKHGEVFKLNSKSSNEKATLEEIKYQLYVMNTK